tara:strand:- start:37 stop:777 length:741 start_codon:yes stop_codon:yes gene_type:complete
MESSIAKHIKSHALKNKSEECCGIIYLDKFQKVNAVEAKNIHQDKEKFFEISVDDISFVKSNYKILAIYHSHISGSCQPSKFDILNSEELCLPFYIYSLEDDDFYLYKPQSSYNEEIIGRHFVEDISNCISCVADYLIQNLKIKIKKPINWSEPIDKKAGNRRSYEIFSNLQKYSNAKCEIIKDNNEDLRELDVLVVNSMRDHFNHFGVVTKDFKVLHHPKDQLAHCSDINDKWRKRLKFIYRLKV